MTIALGFNCPDGIVLCTESLDSDGVFKTKVNKIWCYETQGQWGISVASAGESDFIESFIANLAELFTGEQWNQDWIMSTLRQAINAARTTYPDLEWAALFSLFGPSPLDRRLLRVSHRSKHIAPVSRYEAVGIGGYLAKFLCAQMYGLFMTVEEAAELAVFIVLQCIEHVAGCELPISLLTWKIGQTGWTPHHPTKVQEIIGRSPIKGLRKNLLDYWRNKTPHLNSGRNVAYDELQQGGFVLFRRALPLKPKRSISQKSKRLR
jgi:20S proteasome alpha/beta subunit